MPGMTMIFGMLLVLLGAGTYFAASPDQRSPTALIPSAVGVLLILCGAIARNPAARKHAMHAAAALGTLGFLAAAGKLISVIAKTGMPDGLKMVGMGGMAILCAIFVGMCVKSFIDARRTGAI